MGNTCKSMADSFQCMPKPTTIYFFLLKKKKRISNQNLPAKKNLGGLTASLVSLTKHFFKKH